MTGLTHSHKGYAQFEKMHHFKRLMIERLLVFIKKVHTIEDWIESLPCVLSLAVQQLIKGQFSGFRGSKFATKTARG